MLVVFGNIALQKQHFWKHCFVRGEALRNAPIRLSQGMQRVATCYSHGQGWTARMNIHMCLFELNCFGFCDALRSQRYHSMGTCFSRCRFPAVPARAPARAPQPSSGTYLDSPKILKMMDDATDQAQQYKNRCQQLGEPYVRMNPMTGNQEYLFRSEC